MIIKKSNSCGTRGDCRKTTTPVVMPQERDKQKDNYQDKELRYFNGVPIY